MWMPKRASIFAPTAMRSGPSWLPEITTVGTCRALSASSSASNSAMASVEATGRS